MHRVGKRECVTPPGVAASTIVSHRYEELVTALAEIPEVVAVHRPGEDAQRTGHGHDVSCGPATTISLISQPGGRVSANNTASATSAGWHNGVSGAGLYCSSRSSKKCVCIPPGVSSVTPTRHLYSSHSALVKPTTPNLLAQ